MQAARDALYVNPLQGHRLFTHEDARFGHAHKALGLLSLFHFSCRLCTWATTGSLGFDDTWHTPAWLAVHAALHLTSFQFVLPGRRNQVYNIIWPEMRLHSMLFAYRAVFVMLIIYAEHTGLVPAYLDAWLRGAIVIATMVLADKVTLAYKGTPTMRGNPYPSYVPKTVSTVVNIFYSTSQIFGTLNMLYRGYDLVFLTLVPIQIAPFLMTLEKKGIINQMGWHMWYTLAIIVSYAYAAINVGSEDGVVLLGLALSFLRFGLCLNKYLMWGAVVAWRIYSKL